VTAGEATTGGGTGAAIARQPDLTALARAAAAALDGATRDALAELLLAMADDEFVIGFSDSEWTGIAPVLEEDVAMSSIAQDELGHARALYEVLAGVVDDGRDADAIAYDREPEGYRHARLLDHGRGDWADTIARRFLYDLADAARLADIGDGFAPLADLVAKIRREERYHGMHARAWIERLARGGEEPRRRLVAALEALRDDAGTVLAPLGGEERLRAARILRDGSDGASRAWRADVDAVLAPLGIAWAPRSLEPREARSAAVPSEAFRWLWSEFTSVRRSEDGATW
jgi:ring-1,2-phenylacetyl-CoA epoxidase subunit PaaC